jgi:phage tail sheath gpL-like
MSTAAISFDSIPANLRNPLAYAEVDNKKAGYFQQNSRTLFVGQSANIVTEVPVIVASVDWAKQTFGPGSQIARFVEAYRRNNSFNELWVLPLNDAAGATKASATVTFTGPATASGTVALYVGGEKVSVPVSRGDTATQIGASLVTQVTNNVNLPVTASNAAGVVTLTAKNAGTVGNKVPLNLNFRGVLANEVTPAGVTVEIVAFAGGATDPDVEEKLALIGSMDVAFYAHPYADTGSIAAFTAFLSQTGGRWDPMQGGKDGQAFTALAGSLSALQTFGTSLNDENHTVIGYETSVPNDNIDVLGSYVAQASGSLAIDPARTCQTLELMGVITPPESSRFTLSNRSTLLNSGIATLMYHSGTPAIERAITTYQKNSYGQPDPSYLDVTTRATLSYIKKSVVYLITQKFPRSKLAEDGTKFGAGNAIVTPKDVRAELIAWYDTLQFIGLVQNPEGFEKELLVSLNPIDPNRLDILLPPTLVNNLIVCAVKVEFSLRA